MRVTIGVADCSKYTNYERWLAGQADVDVIKLGFGEDNFDDIKQCHGLLLTGGEDVAPQFYKKPEYLKYCDAENMDERRDAFELKLLAYTQEHNVPVLGICRGLQIANVFFGGTLIPDVPSFGKLEHSKFREGEDRYHDIRINPYSLLKMISGEHEGVVNSAHHQAADKIGIGLTTSAFSADGVVEALERKPDEHKPYLVLVQWHPERMKDQASPLSANIRSSFIEAVRSTVNK